MNEQKETVDGLVDAECGAAVQAGSAGLCRLVIGVMVFLIQDMQGCWILKKDKCPYFLDKFLKAFIVSKFGNSYFSMLHSYM